MSEQALIVPSYTQDAALADLVAIKYAISLFLNSRMVEAEEFCVKCDPKRERLYITCGLSLIQCFKALMSYEDKDLEEALEHITHGNGVAALHRAPAASVTSLVTGWFWDSSGVERIRAMTQVQRHAELLYAETLFAKALLGVVCSGSWLAFIKEALSFRAMINIYMQLGKFVQVMDKEAENRGEGPEDKTIDHDFRSGVELGVGASNLILSLLPNKMLAVVELFGYQGDRVLGLKLLQKTGGWTKNDMAPAVNSEQEGLRRFLTDIALLCFHLVISSFTFEGVDLSMAKKILEWNLGRYPDGVFYLFGQGRLRLSLSQPGLALASYQKAMDVQSQYRNLHYISLWEMAICNYAIWDIPASLKCWRILEAEATWSRACYTYGMAVCLLELGGSDNIREASKLMARVPQVLHKIAGKSIPIEKFVARKARKFESQGKRLLLPALEFAYMFLAINHSPPSVLTSTILPLVTEVAAMVDAHRSNPSMYPDRATYWDDFCLSHFLLGVCLRFIAYPDNAAILFGDIDLIPNRDDFAVRAQRELMLVNKHGLKLELDHWILYHSHFELGRLYSCRGNVDKAKYHLGLVLSGKPLEVNPSRKGKYSNQSALMLRAGAAMESLSR